MKSFFIYMAAVVIAATSTTQIANAQAAWVEPTPTDVTSLVRVYIDLSHPDCGCDLLADWAVSPPPSSEPDLFMWTWMPSDPAHAGGNGSWDNSNPNNVMKQDENNPAHWYKEMVPVLFYGVDPGTAYANGVSFLIKRKNGSAIDGGEPKSADQVIPLEPVGCVDIICPFPTTFFQDEYFIATYDNNMETNVQLQNLGPGEAFISFRYRVNGGPLQTSISTGADADKFMMDYEGEGIFSFAMLPNEFFNLQEGQNLTQLTIRVNRTPNNLPPFTNSGPLNVGCE